MKLEGEYAVNKALRAHRIASGIVYAIWIVLVFHTNDLGHAFRIAAYFFLPMACIWFPDSIMSYAGILWGRGRVIDERSHPTFLQWAGWFVLVIVPLMLIAWFALTE